MYFEDLSMRRSVKCASARQNGGFRSSEKIEPISAVCVLHTYIHTLLGFPKKRKAFQNLLQYKK